MKALIVGRHQQAALPGIEIVRQEPITFPATSRECRALLEDLFADADDAGIEAVVFQNILAQVAMALPEISTFGIRVGAIVNKPGERLMGQKMEFVDQGTDSLEEDGDDLITAVRFVNPRAVVEILPRERRFGRIIRVTVDPPMRFEFSHIEWLEEV